MSKSSCFKSQPDLVTLEKVKGGSQKSWKTLRVERSVWNLVGKISKCRRYVIDVTGLDPLSLGELWIPPPPNSPKKSEIGPVMSVTYLQLVLILLTKFHPDLFSLSLFQDFQSPKLLPMTLDPVVIQNKMSEVRGPSKYQISLRSYHSFLS